MKKRLAAKVTLLSSHVARLLVCVLFKMELLLPPFCVVTLTGLPSFG